MPNPLNYQPSHSAAYYVPPAQFDLKRLLPGTLVTAVIVAGIAIAYGKIEPNIDQLHVRGAAAAAFAMAVGLLSMLLIQIGRVRNPAIAATLGALLSLFALYVMWGIWVHEILLHQRIRVEYADLILHPARLWHIIQILNRSGVWILNGEIQRGFILYLWWFGEGAMVLAAGTLFPIRKLFASDPICRECGNRCKRVPNLPNFPAERQSEITSAIDSRSFDNLSSLPAPPSDDAPELRIRLMSCPNCGNTHVLTLTRIAWTIGHNRRPTVTTTPIIENLLITPEEAEHLTETCAKIREQRAVATPDPR